MIRTTLADAQADLPRFVEKAADEGETVVIRRRGKKDVALVGAEELAGLREAARQAQREEDRRRLDEAIAQADRGEGVAVTIKELRDWVKTGVPPPQAARVLEERRAARRQ